jgi:hypothetical protein
MARGASATRRKPKRKRNPGIGAEAVANAETLNEEDYENATPEERKEACGVMTGNCPGWRLLAWVGGPGWTPRRRWLAYLTKLVRGSEGRGGAKGAGEWRARGRALGFSHLFPCLEATFWLAIACAAGPWVPGQYPDWAAPCWGALVQLGWIAYACQGARVVGPEAGKKPSTCIGTLAGDMRTEAFKKLFSNKNPVLQLIAGAHPFPRSLRLGSAAAQRPCRRSATGCSSVKGRCC